MRPIGPTAMAAVAIDDAPCAWAAGLLPEERPIGVAASLPRIHHGSRRSGIVSQDNRVMLRGAFGNSMRSGYLSPRYGLKLRLWLLQCVVYCVLSGLFCLPNDAWAATSIPMCSTYSECAEAPWPEAPPTGGEMRSRPRQLFGDGLLLDRDLGGEGAAPIHWMLATIESLRLSPLDALPLRNGSQVEAFGSRALGGPSKGVPLEVFRPPCLS